MWDHFLQSHLCSFSKLSAMYNLDLELGLDAGNEPQRLKSQNHWVAQEVEKQVKHWLWGGCSLNRSKSKIHDLLYL